jgi:glycosidase
MRRRLTRLYGGSAERVRSRLAELVVEARREGAGPRRDLDETDIVLITYGDMVHTPGEAPLATLTGFLARELDGVIRTVHVLPFSPYSSDDGFSVIDYLAVDPALGDWADVAALGERFELMFDLVINHVSQRHEWFRQFVADEAPGRGFFLCASPDDDLAAVVRPRSHPLLTPVLTAAGERHVWTTFSADQVDLDFADPDLFLAMAEVALQYVRRGARVLRLDAVAYLFKRVGTPCIHLEETHDLVRLLRDLIEAAAPGVRLLTETNVPHRENVSYFGGGAEAHMVYQFSLPPLLLHALVAGNAAALTGWARALEPPPGGCAFLNFTASHDGIGVRPLEGWVPAHEVRRLVDHVRAVGGHVSSRRLAGDTQVPYELNVSWFDAMGSGADEVTAGHLARFLCSQTVPLALDGVPALYFHSLTGTRNWDEGVAQTGRARTINRHKWDLRSLEAALAEPGHPTAVVFRELSRRLRIRRKCRALRPGSLQEVLTLDDRLFAVRRGSAAQQLLCLHNVSGETITLELDARMKGDADAPVWRDIMGNGGEVAVGGTVCIPPFGVQWLQPTTAPEME